MNQDDILSLCSEYPIDSIIDAELAPGGIENLNYFIKTGDPEMPPSYVLTIIQTPSHSGDLYFPMMNLIQKNGLPVPAPIADRNGNFFNLLGNQKVMLQPCLPGSHLLVPNGHNINHLVAVIAQLHKISYESIGSLSRHPRDIEWINQQNEKLNNQLNQKQQSMFDLALVKVKKLIAPENELNLNIALIHGDLFKDNVLFDNQKITGILDFHHASIGYCMYDLAVIAIDWCQEKNGNLSNDLIQGMLKAYNALKPISQDELEFFDLFLIFAALNFWLSRLIGQKEERARVKDPKEMEQVLKNLIEH